MSEAKAVDLFFREGNSDKVYKVALVESVGGWVVNFQYGRRGSALKAGTKTASALPYDQASKIYDKLVSEKMSGGYVPKDGAKPFSIGDKAGEVSGIACQLLNPIDGDDEPSIQQIIGNDNWIVQEKMDGVRCLVEIKGGEVRGINRKGLYIDLPDPVKAAYKAMVLVEGGHIEGHTIFDGELVGDKHFFFDVLAWNDGEMRDISLNKRLSFCSQRLVDVLEKGGYKNAVEFVPFAIGAKRKAELIDKVRSNGGEGVVFKQAEASYTPGRPNTGGSQLKLKFWDSVTARVSADGKADKRSVAIELRKGNEWVPAGNVTIPANAAIPKPGAIVEVRYLYALESSGILQQPTYLGPRLDMKDDDVDEASSLKFKNEPNEPAPTRRMGM